MSVSSAGAPLAPIPGLLVRPPLPPIRVAATETAFAPVETPRAAVRVGMPPLPVRAIVSAERSPPPPCAVTVRFNEPAAVTSTPAVAEPPSVEGPPSE
jgi:hypothetical protein